METIKNCLSGIYVMLVCAACDLRDSERGDTNFISMLLIIGIVVVLAGLFLTLSRGAMETVSSMVQNFLNSLG